jgi:hypothetical protein
MAAALGLRAQDVTFTGDIQPILEARCLKCHGPKMKMGQLDLQTQEAAMKGGGKGPAIVPSKPELSPLYRHVAGLEKPVMPMDGKLSDKEIGLFREWITRGAKWDGAMAEVAPELSAYEKYQPPEEARSFWSFVKPVKAPKPVNGVAEWDAHPVDAFVYKTLRERKLKPAGLADARTLVRRAYLDLTGLPPGEEQVRRFIEDKSPQAWGKLIDRLLESPEYGERWGRHWMDVARYADSNGYEHDFDRPNAWRYRDYVIQAFNQDLPFDQFLKEQIAGDEFDNPTHDQLIATGFLRSYAKVGFREKDNPQFRYDYLDDMIATIGRGVLGLTVQCARCHNHKFDPVGQADYYALQASLFGYVEVDHPLVPRQEAEAFYAKTGEINGRVKPLRQQVEKIEQPFRDQLLEKKYKQWPENIQKAIFTPEAERTPGQVLLANQIIRTTRVSPAEVERIMPAAEIARKREIEEEIRRIESERPKEIPVAMGITDGDYRFTPDGAGDEPAPGKGIKQEVTEGSFLCDGSKPYQAPPAYFLHHGDMYSRGSLLKPGFPSVLASGKEVTAIPPAHQRTSGRRLALANWLASRDNPLTARVFVNRIWHHHFGRGIVASLDNYGKTGDKPTHPELLDWLAVEFMDRNWSIKAMHRLLMTSRTYRMSSSFDDAGNRTTDAANDYLWKFRPQRLEAEVVRDSILFTSGGLNTKMYGPAVFPELPAEVLASMDKGIWRKQKDGPEVWRRSVYVYRKRGLPLPFFEVFDLPDQNLTCARRNVSTVPTQALTLLHNEWVLKQAGLFADRIATLAGDAPEAQVDKAYQMALSRPPDAAERKAGVEFVRSNSLAGLAHVLLNLNEFIYMR